MPAPQPNIEQFGSPKLLAENLAEHIGGLLGREIEDHSKASLVVSGGSTPAPLFRCLSHLDLSWEKISITLADERWVAPDNKDSNENLVRSLLLQNRARAAEFVPLKNNAPTPLDGESLCHDNLQRVPRPFTVVVLGLGTDGHTASLFPGAAALPEALDLHSGPSCASIIPPDAPHARMSLTLPTLLDAKQIFLHITGQEKMDVLHRAFAGDSVPEMPIRAVLHQKKCPVAIYWAP